MTRSISLGTASSVSLSAGEVRYWTSGSGPAVVFVHGVLANAELWRNVVPRVAAAGYTCIAPDWPLGAHDVPMRADADLRPGAVAGLVTEFLDVLDLEDVTLVANDAGGAITLLLVANGADRVGRIVLTSGDCFEYFFPRIFWPLQVLPRIPGGLTAVVHAMRLRPLHRLPMAFGRLTKRPMSPQVTDGYLLPSRQDRLIRRDLRKFLLGVDNRLTVEAASRLHNFDGPVLLAWSAEDKLFPISLAHRLAAIFPDATVRPIDDSLTFSPEDQPDQLADVISGFLATDVSHRRPR